MPALWYNSTIMPLPPMLEALRTQQEAWVNAFGGWVPLGSMKADDLWEMAAKNGGIIRLRQSIDGEPFTVPLEEARWKRLGQEQLEKDDNFLLTVAMRAIAGENISDPTGSVSFAVGDGAARQCAEHGLTVEQAEALMSGRPVTIQYERTPFGTYADVNVQDQRK